MAPKRHSRSSTKSGQEQGNVAWAAFTCRDTCHCPQPGQFGAASAKHFMNHHIIHNGPIPYDLVKKLDDLVDYIIVLFDNVKIPISTEDWKVRLSEAGQLLGYKCCLVSVGVLSDAPSNKHTFFKDCNVRQHVRYFICSFVSNWALDGTKLISKWCAVYTWCYLQSKQMHAVIAGVHQTACHQQHREGSQISVAGSKFYGGDDKGRSRLRDREAPPATE